jgi:hypothetical protein
MILGILGRSVSLLLIALVISASQVAASSGQGTVQLSISFGSVQGQLTDATLFANGTISMKMTINNQMDTSIGPVQITATGEWLGTRNGQQLAGTINNIVGTAGVISHNIKFNGKGTFTGTLTGNGGQGSFSGSLTASNSPISEVPANQAIPMSGTWSATFTVS